MALMAVSTMAGGPESSVGSVAAAAVDELIVNCSGVISVQRLLCCVK
jgi:hypothetical protein